MPTPNIDPAPEKPLHLVAMQLVDQAYEMARYHEDNAEKQINRWHVQEQLLLAAEYQGMAQAYAAMQNIAHERGL